MTQAMPFDSAARDGILRPIIRYKPDGSGKKEVISARWGTDPRFSDGIEYRFVRSEDREFAERRCLVPASEFHIAVGTRRYRAALEDGNFFYLAGIWDQPLGSGPVGFRIITVPANPEVARHQDRHGAIILRRQASHWLDALVPDEELLVTPPPRTFTIEDITHGRQAQRLLAL